MIRIVVLLEAHDGTMMRLNEENVYPILTWVKARSALCGIRHISDHMAEIIDYYYSKPVVLENKPIVAVHIIKVK